MKTRILRKLVYIQSLSSYSKINKFSAHKTYIKKSKLLNKIYQTKKLVQVF